MIVPPNVSEDNYRSCRVALGEVRRVYHPEVDCVGGVRKIEEVVSRTGVMTTDYLLFCSKRDKKRENIKRNITHASLWRDLLRSNYSWHLVLEHDCVLRCENVKQMCSYFIRTANACGSQFISLLSDEQEVTGQKVDLYDMTPQRNTTAYLISDGGIRILLSRLPMEEDLCDFVSRNIPRLNALSYAGGVVVKALGGTRDINA